MGSISSQICDVVVGGANATLGLFYKSITYKCRPESTHVLLDATHRAADPLHTMAYCYYNYVCSGDV